MDVFDEDILEQDTFLSEVVPANLSTTSSKVLEFIDRIFETIDCALHAPRPPFPEVSVQLKRVSKDVSCLNGSKGHNAAARKAGSRNVKYCWPGDTLAEAERFTHLLAIFGEIRTAILSNTVVTKRDIYYHQPELFGKQENVDKWIDDIAFTCGVRRQDLMVTASPKGLVSGLELDEGSEKVQTIPMTLLEITFEHIRHVKWILVVEKEASFKALHEHNFNKNVVLGPGLIVTVSQLSLNTSSSLIPSEKFADRFW